MLSLVYEKSFSNENVSTLFDVNINNNHNNSALSESSLLFYNIHIAFTKIASSYWN